MATVIGVGMQMTASASGMTKGLSEADRALQLLQKIVEQNQKSLKTFADQADETNQSVARLGDTTSLLATIEVGRVLVDVAQAIASAFTSVGSSIASIAGPVSASLDSLNDLSARTGLNVEALQAYSLAAKMSGVDTATFGKAVQALTVQIGKAAPGDALDKSLRQINLSVTELRQLSPEQQFSAIGQAISQLPTAADRAAASVEIFGKQGAALAPLFREGAASIEELQARAERLGVIVSETQINNVADMNDAFDLVRATVEGIIGQVIGNLAPAVTDVTNQFLKFVEEWSWAEGQGGTGIANAITDVLLQGAEYLAGVFDQFVAEFSGFGLQLTTASQTFDTVGNTFTAVVEALRVVFNGFEIFGNALIAGLGKILEGLGSWVDSDLEAFGRDLSAAGREAIKRNAVELKEAAAGAAQAVTNVFTGGESSPAKAGDGAASEFLRGIRERVQRERAPEFRINTGIEETRERFDDFFDGLVDNESRVTEAMRGFEAAVREVEDPLKLTDSEIRRIRDSQQAVNAEIDRELSGRRAAADAAAKIADEDIKRVDALLKANDAQSKIEQDLASVEREQLRVQEQLNAARAQGDQERADAAAARLAQLDQLQAKLDDEQQAVEQGFGEGFTKAFQATDKGIDDLVNKAAVFGNTGAVAAQQLEQGIARAQQQARDGILTKEAYEKEVQNQRNIFDQRLAAAQRVEGFLLNNLDARQKAEIDAIAQQEKRRKEAAENVKALELKIEEEKARLEAARENRNFRAAGQAQRNVRALEAAQRQEEALADGRRDRIQQAGQQAQARQINDSLSQFQSAATAQVAQFNQAIGNVVSGTNAAFAVAADQARQQAEKIRQLMTPGPRTVQGADVRTAEGAALVIGLASQQLDPALVEARLQTKALQAIRTAIINSFANITATPVRIA